jgi:hypothetical protein
VTFEQAAALKHQGHAVQFEQTIDSNGVIVGERFFHYLTCAQCRKQKLIGELVALGAWKATF